MTDLKTSDLYKTHDKHAELKMKTYDTIYTYCNNTIKLSAKKGELCCYYIVPNFLFGHAYSIINVESCSNYIMDKLIKSNRHVRATFHPPNIIFIDWTREEDY